jgi:hypothetical protein
MKIRSLVLLSLVVFPLFAVNAERVLIPLVYRGNGRFGSSWWTTVEAWNPGVRPWSSAGVAFIVPCPIPEGCVVHELPDGASGNLVTPNWAEIRAPHGLLLSLPDDEDCRPVLSARLYWAPSGQDGWVELPVPLEREFRSTPLRFPLVPFTGVGRTTLRIYALDLHGPLSLRVFVDGAQGYGVPTQKRIILQPSTSPELYPAYGELSLDDFGGPYGGWINITVGANEDQTLQSKIWAFISITSNDSNDVKILPPR